MPLKISLKPNERIILSGAVVTNGKNAATLLVENNVTILREKDILSEAQANSPAKKIYYAIQLMYIDRPNLVQYHSYYWDLVRPFLAAAPRSLGLINEISENILGEQYYKALKAARKLIEYERKALAALTGEQ